MEDIRDVVIIVFGIGATVATITVLTLGLLLFRKITAVIDSAKATMNGVEAFSRDILGPVARASSMLATFRRVIASLLGQDKREPEGADDGR